MKDIRPRAQPRLWLAASFAATVWLTGWSMTFLLRSLRWSLVGDAPILLYMGWLANHGLRLYKEVVEVQFPGSVMLYSAQRAVFGASDHGFRIFDLLILLAVLLLMLWVSRKSRLWFAAVFGFTFFLWTHTGKLNSVVSAGERDFLMAAMFFAAAAAVLHACDTANMRWFFFFGLLVTYACTMKPVAVVYFALPLGLLGEGSSLRRQWPRMLRWTAAGVLMAILLVMQYLVRHQGLGAFFATEWQLLPAYLHVAKMGYLPMLATINYPPRVLPVLMIAAVAALVLLPVVRRDPVQRVCLVGTVCGLLSYLLQHKGLEYHCEPFYIFFFFWTGWVLLLACRHAPASGAWMAAGVLLFAVLLFPHFIRKSQPSSAEILLQSKLAELHAFDQDFAVQCVDGGGECMTVMLRAQRHMATGTLLSWLYFPPQATPDLREQRDRFLGQLNTCPPPFIVIDNSQFPYDDAVGYAKLQNWPAFQMFLSAFYSVRFEQPELVPSRRGFRIYQRKLTASSCGQTTVPMR